MATYLSSCKIDSDLPDAKPLAAQPTSQVPASVPAAQDTVALNITGFLQIQLAKDAFNTDNVLVDFKPDAKTAYIPNEDAPTFQGYGQVSLSSLSSDNQLLAINAMPLLNKRQTIDLAVNAKTDGVYNLKMVTVNAIPALFDIWLIDHYRKDSSYFRQNGNYSFDIIKSDTNSFGSHRFSIVISENQLLGVHLLNFTAAKVAGGAKSTWVTENEQNYTSFSVERSTDNGKTYVSLTSFMSSAAGKYSFVDPTPVSGINNYRLKLVDINQSTRYSNVISLNY